jgi:hypothetical protein
MLSNQSDLKLALLNKQETSEKGQPSGYPELDATGKVPMSQLLVDTNINNATSISTSGIFSDKRASEHTIVPKKNLSSTTVQL